MENEEIKNIQLDLSKLTSLNLMHFLSFEEIMSIFKNSKHHMSIYKQNYIELEKSLSKYYNLNTRKKLNNILPLLQESLPSFVAKIKPDNKLTIDEQLNNLYYILAYSKILNKILRLNKILLFKYTIQDESLFNFYQLISLIMFMDYSKEVILYINNSSLISSTQFKTLINEIMKKPNIVSFSIYFNKNYFTFSRNSKKMFMSFKESNSSDKIFFSFRNIAFSIFNSTIGVNNLCYNFEDFSEITRELIDEKLNFSNVTNIEISFSFTNERKKQLENCLSFLSNTLSYAKINSADKSQFLSLKLQLFALPDGFDYINLAKLISGLHPNNIWLIPYKDIDNKFANEFLTLINESCEINMINIINFVGFDKEHLDKFITKQKNMIDMRICGKMGEEEMEFILNKYYDFLHDKENPEYKIKKISLSGPINMNKKWNDLICKFLTLKQFEAFHLDCFFNEKEFMREIAEAFIDNHSLKSFCVRNTCRPPKDLFPEVLKEALYNRKIPRKEVFNKIKLYKLL